MGLLVRAGPGRTAPLLPLVQWDYTVATSAAGAAPPRDAELVVTASHLPGASTSRVRTEKAEWSYDDGRAWHPGVPRSCPCGSVSRTRRAAR
ncbi:hypothetical protein [Streptomyces sp. NPDC049744]|uniref:hypothetical protein n=1 Tax=Streptomyces sp. NPDC049744 TaxID=3154359 RepID=UPI00342B1AAD